MLGLAALTPEGIALLRHHNLLRPLVERQVVAEIVGTAPLDSQVKQQALQQFLRTNGIANEEGLGRFLAFNGLSSTDLDQQVELPVRMSLHAQEHFRHKAEARFLERKNQLDQVVYSLLRVKDGFLARELYLQLCAGEATFPELAARYAEGPEKATNGIVGPAPLTQAHPALVEKLRTATPGVLMEPFAVNEWWLVVRLEHYAPASFDAAMAQQMTAELFGEWVQQQTSLRLAALTPAAAVSPSA